MEKPTGYYVGEISQKEKDKYHMISLMWNLKNKINKQNRNRLIDAENWWLSERMG